MDLVEGGQISGVMSQQGIRLRNPELLEDRPRKSIGKRRNANSWEGRSNGRCDGRGRSCSRCPVSVL
jgi:hypothetical protein